MYTDVPIFWIQRVLSAVSTEMKLNVTAVLPHVLIKQSVKNVVLSTEVH